MSRLAIPWAARSEPLAAVAVLGLGPVALALGRQLRDRPALAELARVVVAPELLCLLAPSDALPWIDGVRYLGELAPGLYVPTTIAPQVPAELLVRACTARGYAKPLALIPEPARIIPLGLARRVDLDVLARWLGEQEADA